MKTLAWLSLIVLLLPLSADAASYSYPNTGSPLFSIDIPDRWHVEIDQDALHAGPPDKSVYLGFAPLDASLSGDDVGTAVADIISSLIRNPTINSSEDLTIGEMPFSYMEGNGTGDNGETMNFGVAMFSPNGEIICVIFYLGTPENEARYETQLTNIITSIRRGGPLPPPPPPPWRPVTIDNDWKVEIPSSATRISSGNSARYITRNPERLITLDHDWTRNSCRDYLKEEHGKLLKALDNPIQQQLMEVIIIPVDIAGRAALVTEGGSRTPDEARSGSPMHPVSTLALCVSQREVISASISMPSGKVDDQLRDVLRHIAESARK